MFRTKTAQEAWDRRHLARLQSLRARLVATVLAAVSTGTIGAGRALGGPDGASAAAAAAADPAVAPATLDSGVRSLPMPPAAQTLETVVQAIAGVSVTAAQILMFPEGKDSPLLRLNWHPDGASRAARFGSFSEQQRLQLATKPRWAHLVAAFPGAARTLLLDGGEFSLIEAEPATLREVLRRSIPWDLVRPPADRSGEPTRGETAALRARFKAHWLATEPPRVSGMAELPVAWSGRTHARGDSKKVVVESVATNDSQRRFLVATRVKDYPLLQLDCASAEDPSSCIVSRACYLEGAADLKPGTVTGIAVSAARRQLVYGDEDGHRLLVFRYDNCFNSVRVATLQLPAQLKRLTNIAIDAEDRLWASFGAQDDYLNASVVFWQPGEW